MLFEKAGKIEFIGKLQFFSDFADFQIPGCQQRTGAVHYTAVEKLFGRNASGATIRRAFRRSPNWDFTGKNVYPAANVLKFVPGKSIFLTAAAIIWSIKTALFAVNANVPAPVKR